jgi:hypothetical protein
MEIKPMNRSILDIITALTPQQLLTIAECALVGALLYVVAKHVNQIFSK